MDTVKCCKTCVHSTWELTKNGMIKRDHSGACGYKVIWPTLPIAIYRFSPPSTSGIGPDDGQDCPCWEENPGALQGTKW